MDPQDIREIVDAKVCSIHTPYYYLSEEVVGVDARVALVSQHLSVRMDAGRWDRGRGEQPDRRIGAGWSTHSCRPPIRILST